MQKVILDGQQLMRKESAHPYLAEQFSFPDYYGNNLDALYDCLTDICEETIVEVKTYDLCKGNRECYLKKVLEVLKEAEVENGSLTLLTV